MGEHPNLKQIEALKAQADEQVRAQKSRFHAAVLRLWPIRFEKETPCFTESDWAFGVGMKLSLLSNHNRYRQVKAAQSQGEARNTACKMPKVKLEHCGATGVVYRRQRPAAICLVGKRATECAGKPRLQDLSFQTGRATSLDVIDARLQKLGKVRIERAQAAWQFDLALAQLLDVSGQSQFRNLPATSGQGVINERFKKLGYSWGDGGGCGLCALGLFWL